MSERAADRISRLEDALRVGDHAADLGEQLAEPFLVDLEVRLRALRELGEAASTARVEEQLGDHAREVHAAREHGVGALLLEPLGVVARGDDLLSAFGELPLLEQPAADGRMVDAETLLLALINAACRPCCGPSPAYSSGTA